MGDRGFEPVNSTVCKKLINSNLRDKTSHKGQAHVYGTFMLFNIFFPLRLIILKIRETPKISKPWPLNILCLY